MRCSTEIIDKSEHVPEFWDPPTEAVECLAWEGRGWGKCDVVPTSLRSQTGWPCKPSASAGSVDWWRSARTPSKDPSAQKTNRPPSD